MLNLLIKKANETQYDVNKETPKLYILFSDKLDKYEYLTSNDLAPKTKIMKQRQFEYSLLS